jgi:hypothetical protein
MLYEKAVALCRDRQWQAALDLLESLARPYPEIAELHYHAGLALVGLDRLHDAAAHYRRAVAANPQYIAAHANLGIALHELGALDDALGHHDRAIALAPQELALYGNRASTRLLAGDFAGGFADYEWRKQRPDMVRLPAGTPEWRGELLQGKSLLIRFEQGLGDTIQFCRYAPLIAASGARVVLAVPARLVRLLRGLAPGVDVVDADTAPACDFQVLLLSLPHLLGTTVEGIPWPGPYLRAEPERRRAWGEAIGGHGFRIGIAWQGKSGWSTDKGRSIPLAAFAPLASVPGVRLVSLQKHEGTEQLSGLPQGMAPDVLAGLDEGPDAFIDTAAVMANMDLVVTSDTAIAHLAGALGKRVWLALKKVPDWRWMMTRQDSPWYPGMELFRQAQDGDWADIFHRMRARLEAMS